MSALPCRPDRQSANWFAKSATVAVPRRRWPWIPAVGFTVRDSAALSQLVTDCYRQKLAHAAVVADRSWDQWAEDHHRLFMRLLHQAGIIVPPPGTGFRFGMMRELGISSGLEIPPSQDISALEDAVDRAAACLYYGRSAEALAILKTSARHFPIVQRLITTLS